jgi:flagellar biosynthesis chaperone FliJ
VAVSRTLRRVLRIRNLAEEQSQLALESAMGELNRLEHALMAAAERDRRGRRLVEASVRTGELPDRLAGLEETRWAGRHAAALAPRIADAELDVATLRQEFLLRRIERRQAETLIEEAEARDAVEAGRREQRVLDDWFRNRLHREKTHAEPPGSASPRPGAQEMEDVPDGT